jgi:hypothetical protein
MVARTNKAQDLLEMAKCKSLFRVRQAIVARQVVNHAEQYNRQLLLVGR